MLPSAPKDGAGLRGTQKADAAIAAATLTSPSSEHRSTADQRQAFLEHLYTDYGELHAQQGEIHDRKNRMDFDMFESNQQEIHDVLFANVEAVEGALGDWDTWEKVEAVMKRYAYGRPRHTAQEREEDVAMRSRIDTLSEVASERDATIRTLTQTCTATQQELAALLKLLHGKDNEIKTLTNQHHTASLQLRYVQRECAELRGLRNDNERSLLKQDLSYLIQANKKLESENQLLRARQLLVQSAPQSASPPTAAPSEEPPSTFVPLQPPPPQPSADEDDLERCLDDDAFRREFLHKEVPLSGAVVSAKRETAHWKRRLEAEVQRAMELLDRDAAQVEVAAPPSDEPSRRGRQEGMPQLHNGVFISYASYDSVPGHRAEVRTVPVLSAPAAASVSAAPAVAPAPRASLEGGAKRKSSSAAVAKAGAGAADAATEVRASGALADAPKARRKSTSTARKGAAAGAPSPTARKATASAAHESNRRASLTAPFAPLRSAILQCAELSRANAMRRELLHVAHLRQLLVDELTRAVADAPSQHAHADGEKRRASPSGDGGSVVPAAGDTSRVDSPTSPEAWAPLRLRQRVHESRPTSHAAVEDGPADGDGGEVRSSATLTAPGHVDAGHQHPLPEDRAATRPASKAPSTRTPTPPPLSRQHGSRPQSVRPTSANGDSPVMLPLGVCVAPLRERASGLRGEVAALRESVVVYWQELQEALALLGGLFEEQGRRVAQAVERQAEETAMGGAAERVLEEAALQRTAQILKDRFGSLLPADAFAPAALPETATDEEWLVNQLHTAAAAMIKESVHPTAAHAAHGEGAARAGQPPLLPPPTTAPSTTPSRQHARVAEREYYEAEVLRPFRMQPTFGNGGPSHKTMALLNGDVVWTGDADEEAEGGDEERQHAGGRAVGGVDARARNRPAPPAQWNWRTRNTHNFSGPAREAAAEPRPPVATHRHPLLLTTAPPRNASSSSSSPAGVQSIKPTVLRYVFGSRAEATPRAVTEHIHEKTAFLYGSEFDGFVQEYIVPVISTASRFATGGKMNPALRAAVQDLRQKERARRKRGVRLLFDRVVNNVRTRNLLQRNVFHGEAFASYVGVLYGNWRAKLEGDRRRVQSAEETNRNALFSLLQLQSSNAPEDTFTRPTPPPAHPPVKTKPAAAGSKRVVKGFLSKSSFHFENANFGTHS